MVGEAPIGSDRDDWVKLTKFMMSKVWHSLRAWRHVLQTSGNCRERRLLTRWLVRGDNHEMSCLSSGIFLVHIFFLEFQNALLLISPSEAYGVVYGSNNVER